MSFFIQCSNHGFLSIDNRQYLSMLLKNTQEILESPKFEINWLLQVEFNL